MSIPNTGRPEAADIVWNWRASVVTSSAESSTKMRNKGLIHGGIGILAGFVFWLIGLGFMAFFVSVVAIIVIASAIVSPTGVFAILNRGAERLARWLSNGISWIILVLLYATFFIPFGMLFRKGKRDTLARRFDVQEASYWKNCDQDAQMQGSRSKQY